MDPLRTLSSGLNHPVRSGTNPRSGELTKAPILSFGWVALGVAFLAGCNDKSDAPAAEKEFFVLSESEAGIAQLCASATKVAAIYTVEGNDPEKIKEWNGMKAQACQAAENSATLDAKYETERAKTEALLKSNEEAIARMQADR